MRRRGVVGDHCAYRVDAYWCLEAVMSRRRRRRAAHLASRRRRRLRADYRPWRAEATFVAPVIMAPIFCMATLLWREACNDEAGTLVAR